MEVSVAQQALTFLYSICFGLFLGAVYDIFRIIRVALPFGKAAVFLQDALFLFIASILTFLFIFNANYGEIRFFLILGTFLGAFVYYFTIGIIVMKSAKAVINALKKFLKAVFRAISKPIMKIYLFFMPKIKKNAQKIKKIIKILKNLFKFKLKECKIYNNNRKHNKKYKIHKQGDDNNERKNKIKSSVKNIYLRRNSRDSYNDNGGVRKHKSEKKRNKQAF